MRNFKEYQVWQLGQDAAVDLYEITNAFDPAEKFGITSQLRRAVVSISSNVAEGCSRSSEKEFARFIEIATGSAFEVISILTLCVRLKMAEGKATFQLMEDLDVLGKKLNALRTRLIE